jgi:hypothetical protein
VLLHLDQLMADGQSLAIAPSLVVVVSRGVHVATPHLLVGHFVWEHPWWNAIPKVATRMVDGVNGRHAVNHVERAIELEHATILLLHLELIVMETQQRNVIHNLAMIQNKTVDGVVGAIVLCSVEPLARKIERAIIPFLRMEGSIVWAMQHKYVPPTLLALQM